MITVVPKQSCVGCSACLSVCPVDAISMEQDTEHFLYPKVDEEVCTECGECLKVCPALGEMQFERLTNPFVWAALSKDETVRKSSSSGGLFYELAKVILKKNGIVYGAAFNADFNLVHKSAVTEAEVLPLMGSKYLQSTTNRIFSEVKTKLDVGKEILFSGTPCQVAGLNTFLRKDYPNLITCDVICHGVASPGIFKSYINMLEAEHTAKVIEYKFRAKPHSWRHFSTLIRFDNGEEITEPFSQNLFMKGYLADIYLRPSCYDCKYSRIPRVADITLGDFWGIWDIEPGWDDDKGTTALIANSIKGKQLINEISLKKREAKLEWVISGNPALIDSVRPHKKRRYFYKEFNSGTALNEIIRKCLPPPTLYDKILWSINRRIKKMIQ